MNFHSTLVDFDLELLVYKFELLVFYQNGLSHKGVFVPWDEVKQIKIMHFQSYHDHLTAWIRTFGWRRMTIETKAWKVGLDSRATLRRNANGDDVRTKVNYDISPAFDEARKLLQLFCPDKIIFNDAFAGGFDFDVWSSWLLLAMIVLAIILISFSFFQVLRPYFI